MTLGSWGGVTGRNFSIPGLNSTWNPMFESVKNEFRPKQALSIFSHWLIIIERSQNWPVLRSPISTFWDTNFVDTVTCINHSKFEGNCLVGVALTIIQTFMRWGHLTWPGDLTLRNLGLKFSKHMRKRCMITCAKNGSVTRRRFWQSGKPEGVSTTPHNWAKVNVVCSTGNLGWP